MTVTAHAPPVAYFARVPAGWHQYSSDFPGALALSWRYHFNRHGWVATMPKGGIAVSVFFPVEKPRYGHLRLTMPAKPFTMLKGTTDTLEYRIRGRVRGVDVEIWVDIRQRTPSRRQLLLAQRAVSAVRFK